MENLEHVVRERNRAYYELETDDSGEIFSIVLIILMKIYNKVHPILINNES